VTVWCLVASVQVKLRQAFSSSSKDNFSFKLCRQS